MLGESVITIMFYLILENNNADHEFNWNNVEILHFESNKGKREFTEMLYTIHILLNDP